MSPEGRGKEREVVITGMGLLTPLGIGVEENWENVKALKTGIGHYPQEGMPGFLQYFGKVREFETKQDIPAKLSGQMRFLSRGSLLGFAAAREAVAHSGINVNEIPPARRALYLASGDTSKVGYDFLYSAMKDATHGQWQEIDFEVLNRSTLNKVSPFFLLESIMNNLFSFLSAFFEFMGPNTTLGRHSPSGGSALELACRSIRQGAADIGIAVGCGNWITEIPLYEMERLGILSRCREGIRSYRPFDRRRDGFIPGEGGAALFLEASEVAERRGARVWGKIRGFGNGIDFSDVRDIMASPQTGATSMTLALEEAGFNPSDIGFFCLHGSGSEKGDRSELASIREVWGPKSQGIPICGMKPYTGHLGAASDLAEVILGVRSAAERMVPGTLNFEEPDPEWSELLIRGSHQLSDGHSFLSTSYGMGGQSSAVVIEVP